MTGTIVNVLAVVAGSLLGLALKKNLPQRFQTVLFQAIGLFTLFMGIKMGLLVHKILILVFSMVLGAITGESLQIEEKLNQGIVKIKNRFFSEKDRFAEGLTGAFILFCLGSMTILGAIEEGLGGKPEILLAKSLMDGVSSIALASALGAGVLFSAIPLFIYQGGLTLFAAYLQNHLDAIVIDELSAVGGLLLIGLGLNLLNITRLKLLNFIPALIFAVLLALIFK